MPSPTTPVGTEVLVLGAGFSGLAAALRLRERGVGVHVVEARERVGGRTHTRRLLDGLQIDLGGQWIGPTQTRMYELAAEHDIEIFPLQEVGEGFSRHDGDAETVARLYREVDALAETVDLADPAATPGAAALDKQTLHTWLRERADEASSRYVGRTLAGGLLGKDAGEVSVLQIAFYVRSGSGVDVLLDSRGGAQQDRMVGGPEELARRMAARLGDGAITHGFAVAALRHADGAWHAAARDGRVVTAGQVISAIPAPLLLGLDVEPALPPLKRRAIRALTTGHSLKLHAVYPSPSWRERGLSGVFNSADGLITEAVDNSVPGHSAGVLSFFVYGDDSARVAALEPAERRRVLLDELAERLGDPGLADPIEFVDFSWDDEPFTRGCFSSTFAVGALHRHMGDLRASWHGMHMAGTEVAEVWNGYFEGAVRSGERAAETAAAAIGAARG